MTGTSMLHGICGKKDIFETLGDASDCAKDNIMFKLLAGVIVGIICLIISMLFIPENSYKKKIVGGIVITGFTMMYINSHKFPYGPVRQYYTDKQDIETRLRYKELLDKELTDPAEIAKHKEDIRFAKDDLIKDRRAEQAALNQGRRQGFSGNNRYSNRNNVEIGGIKIGF
jgi:hypothetical protein